MDAVVEGYDLRARWMKRDEALRICQRAMDEISRDRVVLFDWRGIDNARSERVESVRSVERFHAIARHVGPALLEDLAVRLTLTQVDVSQQRGAEAVLARLSDEEIEERLAHQDELARAARSHGERDRRAEGKADALRREQALRRASAR